MSETQEIIQLLRRIAAGIDRLAPVEAPSSGLSRDDRAVLAALLPAISMTIGDVQFTASDLAEEATDDDELQAAITACGLNGRQLGRLFARGCNTEVAGHRIERAGEVRDGVLWRVRR